MKRPIVITMVGAALTATTLVGCTNSFHNAPNPAATRKAAAVARDRSRLVCSEQVAWNLHGEASLKALYADTGALAADASVNNLPGVTKAGRKLASDATAAATLPLPPVDPGSWKALTVDYAAAGTALADDNAGGAVPQLEAGNSAISAFTSAAGKCSGAKL
jgi:hypothetical protein